MKLRIVAGKNLSEPVGERDLDIIYQSPNLIVQGSADVYSSTSFRKQHTVLAGNIVGLRENRSRLDSSLSAAPRFLWDTLLGDLTEEGIGDRCRNSLEGAYILGVIRENDSCDICLDSFGKSDLYYQEVDGRTVFATDLDLLPVSRGSAEYDQAALAHALCMYGYRPPKQHTIYHGVRRLGINQWVHIRDGQVEVKESPFHPFTTREFGERDLNEYADMMLDAVRARGSPDGNVVYLSSGWDSTALLACLVKIFGSRKVRCVIGRMQYAERSGIINQFEIDRAKSVADYFGVRLDIAEFDYRSRGPDLVEQLRPLLRSHQLASLPAINHAILAEFVARTTGGDEVVFVGEISDGAHNLGFSQFVTIFHPVLEFREYSDKMASYLFGPTFLGLLRSGQFTTDPIYGLLRGRCGEAIFDELAIDDLSRRKQLLASFFLRSNRMPLWSLRNSKMLTKTGREVYSTEMESTYLSRAAQELTDETLYSWYLHLYNSFHWQSSTVATAGVTAGAHGLRVALPFWDSRIQEFLSAMPEGWGRGLDLNPTKYPLKWMLKNRIDYPYHLQVGPHSYLYDIDPSFSHSAEIIYGSAFAPFFKDLLRSREYHDLLSSEVFDLAYIDGMVNRYFEGTEVRGAELNDLMSLSVISMVGWYGN